MATLQSRFSALKSIMWFCLFVLAFNLQVEKLKTPIPLQTAGAVADAEIRVIFFIFFFFVCDIRDFLLKLNNKIVDMFYSGARFYTGSWVAWSFVLAAKQLRTVDWSELSSGEFQVVKALCVVVVTYPAIVVLKTYINNNEATSDKLLQVSPMKFPDSPPILTVILFFVCAVTTFTACASFGWDALPGGMDNILFNYVLVCVLSMALRITLHYCWTPTWPLLYMAFREAAVFLVDIVQMALFLTIVQIIVTQTSSANPAYTVTLFMLFFLLMFPTILEGLVRLGHEHRKLAKDIKIEPQPLVPKETPAETKT
jgi:hypothetical protein